MQRPAEPAASGAGPRTRAPHFRPLPAGGRAGRPGCCCARPGAWLRRDLRPGAACSAARRSRPGPLGPVRAQSAARRACAIAGRSSRAPCGGGLCARGARLRLRLPPRCLARSGVCRESWGAGGAQRMPGQAVAIGPDSYRRSGTLRSRPVRAVPLPVRGVHREERQELPDVYVTGREKSGSRAGGPGLHGEAGLGASCGRPAGGRARRRPRGREGCLLPRTRPGRPPVARGAPAPRAERPRPLRPPLPPSPRPGRVHYPAGVGAGGARRAVGGCHRGPLGADAAAATLRRHAGDRPCLRGVPVGGVGSCRAARPPSACR
mmetsp:Transcript_77912/g.240537  ORF Transcript_77912/g.240537 Transcript_77912/m.240537 type:complete len:320 (+) Transcript_77912:1270-2229(+)